MPKILKLGKHKAAESEIIAEVARLMKLGFTDSQIATRINPHDPPSRMTIYRIKRKLEKQGGLEQAQAEQRETRIFKSLALSEFETLPELNEYVTTLKGIGKKTWRTKIGRINRICNDLGIFPLQLTLKKALEWKGKIRPTLQSEGRSDLETNLFFRAYNNALRDFLRNVKDAQGKPLATDAELKQAGIDAKHYLDGRYATVLLTESQITEGIDYLKDRKVDPVWLNTLAVFRIGTECCCPAQEIDDILPNSFFQPEGDNQFRLRTLREKTGMFWTKYPNQETVNLWLSLKPNDSDGSFFSRAQLNNGISTKLKDMYRYVRAADPYFYKKPLHALRHCGAQRILRVTEYNYSMTAELGGWESELTLHQHYGAIPSNIVHETGKRLWN